MLNTPRLLALVALNLAIGVYLLYTGISVLRDPRAIKRGVLGMWGRMWVKLFGPDAERVNQLSAKPGAIVTVLIGIWFIVLAILPFFIPFW